MKKHGLWIVVILNFAGVILGTLGTWSVPLGHGISAFWPAFVVQVAGSAWFGGWGVLAAVLFPILTNALTNVGWSGILGFIPANLAQGLIPAWAFRHFRVDPAIPGHRGVIFYAIWGALIPAMVGGLIGSVAVIFFGEATWSEYPLLVVKWATPNMVVSLLIGIPIMRELTPVWRDLGMLAKGWWVFKQEGSQASPRHFRDIPIQVKLALAMCGVGLGPLLVLSILELARNGGNSATGSMTPLLLTSSLVVLALAVGLLSRETVRPLQELKEQVEALMKRRDGALTIERADEIGQLGKAFARLLDDRRHAELSLQASEEKYRMLVENLNVGVFQSTLDGTFLHANSAVIHMAGYDDWEEFKQMPASSLYANRADREELIAELKTQGYIGNVEVRSVRKDGTIYWLAISAVLLKENEGEPISILGSVIDITQRKQAEAARLVSESNLQSLINNREEAIWSLDKNYNLIICNDYFRKSYRAAYNVEINVGINLVNILSPELKAFWKPKYDAALSGEKISFEFKETIQGDLLYFNVFLVPILSEGGVTGASVLSVDITKQKRAEAALRETEYLYRKMNENSPLGMHFYKINNDDQLIFMGTNPAADRLLGVDNSQFIGKTIEEAFPPLVKTEVPERYRAAAAKGITWSTEQIVYEDKQIAGAFEVRAFQTTPGNMVAVFADITERKLAEDKIRKLSRAVEQSNASIVITDNIGRIEYVNPHFSELTGYTFEEAIGQNPRILQSGLTKREIYVGLWKTITNGEEWRGEFCNRKKNGELYWESASISPIVDGTGTITHFVAVKTDITERKLADAALHESEEKFRKAFLTSPDSVNINRLQDGKYVSINPGFTEIMGYSEAEVIGRTSLEIPLWDNPEDRKRLVEELKRNGEVHNLEARFRHKDGGFRYGLMSASVIELNGIPHIISITRDITERRRAEDALRESEERFRRLANNAPDIIFRYDFVPEMKLTFINPAVEKTTYYTPAECYADPLLMLNMAHPDDAMMMAEYLQSRKPPSDPLNMRWLDKYGATHWMESRLVPIFDETNQLVAVEGITRDTTDRKLADLEREKLITELSAKNAELERFTYTVSHDLKSPIVTIRGFLGYLAEDVYSGNTARMENDIQRITNATDKMQDLLRDLLELSRIGRMMNAPETIQFEDLLHDSLDLVHGQLEARGITVLTQPNLPVVYGDRQRLTEVLQNLLDNAIKYMGNQPDPRIEIGQHDEEAGRPIIFIKDNGIGIAPEYHERIFGLFNKLDPLSDGTGIGLALVKRIVEVHGGRIWVESEPGKGSTFYFSLPTN